MDTRSYFDTLGLPMDASMAEAKRSYKKLVKKWHPDQFAKDPEKQKYAQEKLTEINVAYRDLVATLKSATVTKPMAEQSDTVSDRHANSAHAKKKMGSVFSRMASIFKSQKNDTGAEAGKPQTQSSRRTSFDMGPEGQPASQFQRELKRAVRMQPRRTPVVKSQGSREKPGQRSSGRNIAHDNYAAPGRSQGDRVEKIRPVRRVGKI